MENESREGVPPDDESTFRLQQLAIYAQQQPPRSSQRQLALNRLVNAILQCDRICHPQRGMWHPSLYEDLYSEALQKTLLEICKKIDSYNPERPVMAWVNFLLDKRFIDVVNEYRRRGLTYISPANCKEAIISLPYLDELDSFTPGEQTQLDAQMLQQFIEDDPENLLRNEHLRGHPEANFQYLALVRFVEDKTWEEISTELEISVQTLCSFFNRRLEKLIPYFRKYLQDY